MLDAIVLAGGPARRLGGADKPALDVGGRTLLQRALDAVAAARADRVVVVGPRPAGPLPDQVGWCQEDPPGSGPLAAIAAGLDRTGNEYVLVLAADLPFVAGAVPTLLTAVTGHDVAVLVDADGRENYVAALWRRAALASALAGLGTVTGVALRSLYRDVDAVAVPDDGWGADCDTWDDVRAARARAEATGHPRGHTP